LKNDLKVYVYPLQRSAADELQTIPTVKVKPDLQPLYDYLVRRGSFVQLDNYNPKYLPIFSRDVLKRIASEMVPPQSLPAVAGCRDHPPARFLRLQETLSARVAAATLRRK
jgi:hypothetical protein